MTYSWASYLILVYGGCEGYLHKSLKVIQKAGSPDYIRGMFSNDYGRMTRQALSGMIKPSQSTQVPRTEIAATSFRHRALQDYNLLPENLKNSATYVQFKILAKKWIMENTPIDWRGATSALVMFTTPSISNGWKLTPKYSNNIVLSFTWEKSLL